MLSLSRIGLAIPIFALIVMDEPRSYFLATGLFILAASTDLLDGYLARSLGFVSSIGIFLDLTSDKIFVSAVLIALIQVGVMPGWIVAIVVGGEFFVTGLRTMAMSMGRIVPSEKWGKRRTAILIFAMSVLLMAKGLNAHRLSLFASKLVFNSQTLQMNEILLFSAELLFLLVVIATMLFGTLYMIRIYHREKVTGNQQL